MDSPALDGTDAFDRVRDAARYEVVSGGFDPELFAAAGIGARDRVLDIGCGYGSTTLNAARRARLGQVTGNDVAEPMLEQARRFAAAEGLGNVTFEAGDAQTRPFTAGGFDVAISRFGVMFFADPVAAFANIARALRPGGRLVFTTVGPQQRNDLPQVVAAAMPAAAAVHALEDPEHLGGVLTRAGFHQVTVTSVEKVIVLRGGASAAAEFLLSWGAFGGTNGRDGGESTARAALTAAARPFVAADGDVRLRSSAWLVSAERPEPEGGTAPGGPADAAPGGRAAG